MGLRLNSLYPMNGEHAMADPTVASTRLIAASPEASLQDRLAPIFQCFFDLVEELMSDSAVHHAMVIT
jgi:hypothetical protein